MPKISIVLPCHNGARFLSQSLDSILRQTSQDWELIIVNDCSTDATPQIAAEYAARDSRIRVLHNKTNRKLPGTLNVGFDDARGRYLTWTSDDNIAKDNWLETLEKYLDTHPDTDLVSANMDMIDETGRVYDIFRRDNTDKIRELAYKCNIGAAFMYRREIADKIGRYDESMFCAEDYDYWVRIALAGRIDYIADNIYQYRENPQSLTATQQPRVLAKTAAIHKKYMNKWTEKLSLGWWGRKKLEYLMRHFTYPRSEFSIVGIRHTVCTQAINALFFAFPRARHKLKKRFKIKI